MFEVLFLIFVIVMAIRDKNKPHGITILDGMVVDIITDKLSFSF